MPPERLIDIAVMVLGGALTVVTGALAMLYRQVEQLRDQLQTHQLRVATDYHSKEEVREVMRAELQTVHATLADIKATLIRGEDRDRRRIP